MIVWYRIINGTDEKILIGYEIRDMLLTPVVYFSTIVNNFCVLGNTVIIKST